MVNNSKKSKLGRGLDTLLGPAPEAAAGSTIFTELPISQIKPNPNQPRTDFDPEALKELADSIRENGIISPITVRKIDDETYQIIAGERRYRAAQDAGLDKIPAYIREVDDNQVLQLALIENIQREDLNAIEIALSYNSLSQTFNLTQEQISQRVGKNRSTIANYLRLLKLPAEIQLGIKDHRIEMGHARALAGVESPERQIAIYQQIIAESASVRRAEELCTAPEEMPTDSTKQAKKSTPKVDLPEKEDIEDGLNMLLGSPVKLDYGANGRGKIVIRFKDDDELERLMKLFEKLKD